ncbi:MAG: DUF5686 family protein [Ignavibacteriaceae bacterium]
MALARGYKANGKICDSSTGKGISYVIIKEINGTKATTANSEGYYEISLNSGNNILIYSSIGYTSDTVRIDSSTSKTITNIYLKPSKVLNNLPQVPAEKSSASDLMIKVIDSLQTIFSKLKNYSFIAHNRYVTRENDGVGIGTGSIIINGGIFKESLNLVSNIWETKPLKIDAMNEFLSKGFFSSPDSFSEVIESQKARLTLPASLNVLLGTRRIQNLCSDELSYYDRHFPGPLANDALNYYKYYFADTVLTDGRYIFKIYFEPSDKNDPGLTGYLFVSDSSCSIMKIDASLNQSANSGNSFESVSMLQQFIPYPGGIILPLDYRMFVKSNYVGIVKIEYELSSLIGDYKVNSDTNNNDAKNSVLTVLPETRKLDLLSHTDQEIVPLTQEESNAKDKIDSTRFPHNGFFSDVSKIVSPQYRLSDNYSMSGPLSIYQFNHVEGSVLSLSGAGNNLFDNTVNVKLSISNGFSDNRIKESIATSFYPDEDRSIILSLNAYNKLAVLFSSTDMYGSLTSTVYSLFSNHDFRNYYYTHGFDLKLDGEVMSFMRLNAAYSNHTDHSAQTNTTFSLLGNSGRHNYNYDSNSLSFPDSVNSPIYDTRLSAISLGVNLDFRDDIIENNLKRKVSNGHTFLSFGAGILISSPKYLGSDLNFISYSGNVLGEINTFKTSSLSFEVNGIYSKGPVPLQMQYALPGNISGTGRDLTFRTIGVGNLFGDQALTLNIEYNFRKEIYRIVPVTVLQNLSLNTFFNAAWKNMSEASAVIMPIPFTVLTKPLLEAGFNLGYLSLPISLEFAWRLTYISRSSLTVGINTNIL